MKKLFLLLIVSLILISSIGLMACSENLSFTNSENLLVAKAEEESNVQALTYTNWSLLLENIPMVFLYDHWRDYDNWTSNSYYNHYHVNAFMGDDNNYSNYRVQFIAIVEDIVEGVIYSENIYTVSNYLFYDVIIDEAITGKYNSLFLVTTESNSIITTQSSRLAVREVGDVTYQYYSPGYTSSANYPFRIYFSVLQGELVNLDNIRVKVSSMYDYSVHPDDPYIWYSYRISRDTHSNTSLKYLGEEVVSHTDTPLFQVKQSADSIYNSGYSVGYNQGYNVGNTNGYNTGYAEGNSAGYDSGFRAGYYDGKIDGIAESNDYTFLGLLSSVVDAPVKVITGTMTDTNNDGIADTRVGGLLNFDMLGVNISSFLLALFSVCVILAVVRVLMSR